MNVPREQMPQIREEDIPRLLVYLGNLGIKFSAGELPIHKVVHHQDINWEIAKAIASDAFKLRKPVLVVEDDALIDGNHRAAAHKVAGKEFIGYIRLSVSFEHAIPLLNSFPLAYNKSGKLIKNDIHEAA